MNTKDNSPSVEEQVNSILSSLGDDGKVPEDLDPVLRFAVTAEKRRRDTQSAYTKSNLENKRLSAETAKLFESLESTAISSFSDAEQTELAELKSQDPDAWHARLMELKETKKSKVKEQRQRISDEANQVSELELRTQALETFNAENPDIAITDEVIENDIPPRLTKQLADGKIEFSEFLNKCKDYLTKGKVVAPAPAPDEGIDLDDAPGGSRPSQESLVRQNKTDYTKEIY